MGKKSRQKKERQKKKLQDMNALMSESLDEKELSDNKIEKSPNRFRLQNSVLHILLIAIVGLLVYSNTFYVPFLFDDNLFITENPLIKNLQYFIHPSNAKGFNLYDTFKSRFVSFLTFALNYQLHGLNVTGYHIFNLTVHIINALLVYWLVLLTLRMPFFRTTYSEVKTLQTAPYKLHHNIVAFFSSLLFVVHPVQTQAVTYIWQRSTSLVTMFYLLSIVMYSTGRLIVQNQELHRRLSPVFCYLFSFLSAVLAMKTKEIAFTLPIIIVLYEFTFFKGRLKSRVLYLIPVFSTMLIIPLTLLGTDKSLGALLSDVGEATRVETTMSRLDYLFTQFRVIVTYVRLLLFPINQILDYNYPIYYSFFDPKVILSCFFIASILGIGIYLFYRSHVNSHYSRLIAFGIFWFFITLSVESSVIPIVDVIFEHRVYLPSVGFFLAFVVGFAILVERINSKVVVRVVVAGVITAGVLLGGMTYGRNRVWQNAITLWEDVLKKSPNNARAHNNLGNAYVANNMFDNAIEHFEKSSQLSNDYGQLSNYNLGVIYHNKGLIDLAISKYQKALKLETAAGTSPHIYSYIHNNLGLAYQSKNLHYKAIQHFQSSISLKPDEPNAHSDIGVSYLSIGLRDDAIRHFKTALRLSPGHKEAQSNLRRANFK